MNRVRVRTGKSVLGDNGDRWEVMVHDYRNDDESGEVLVSFWGSRKVVVENESGEVVVSCREPREVVVERFRYGSRDDYFEGDMKTAEKDARKVHLSALGHACSLAAELENREWWRLRCHFRNSA